MMRVDYRDGVAILGDVCDPHVIAAAMHAAGGMVPLVVADPPYGRIVGEKWDDMPDTSRNCAVWMMDWVHAWSSCLLMGGAFYVWGGTGRPGFRPFYNFMSSVEGRGVFQIANHITWKKKRAYGVQNNYLYTREECAYLVLGDAKKPRTFNVPLLAQKRGYDGYNKDYPAKSEYLRRSNVWDESEIFRGKLHVCQKADRVSEIPIEVHTSHGETVMDLFAGSARRGGSALSAHRVGRGRI